MRDQWWRAALWGAVPLTTLALACMPVLGLRAMVAVIAIWLSILAVRACMDPVPIARAQVRWCLFLCKREYQAAPEIEVVLVRYSNVEGSVFYVVWQLFAEVALH